MAAAGEEQLTQQGLTLGASYLSEEGKLRPASWHCEARYPELHAGKTLSLRVSPCFCLVKTVPMQMSIHRRGNHLPVPALDARAQRNV
jgi:hypothetical protein